MKRIDINKVLTILVMGMRTTLGMSVIVLFDTGISHSFISQQCVSTLALGVVRCENALNMVKVQVLVFVGYILR
jgi:hypothetical protein